MSTHTWPQVPRYSGSRRGTERARWPAGIAVATLSAAALLSACGGNACADGFELDAATGECVQQRKDVGPVDCLTFPDRCV